MWGNNWGEIIWGQLITVTEQIPIGSWVPLLLAFIFGVITAITQRHKSTRIIPVLAMVIIPAAVFAATVSLPHTFENGKVADADEVNANFEALATESNSQDTRLSNVETENGLQNTQISSMQTVKQDRVTGLCPPGSSIRVINPNGSVTCELDNDSNSGGDITQVTAGTGLSGGGIFGAVTLSHADTSNQSSLNNSNGSVIQDVLLDGNGHVTSMNSTNLDGRYYTESESNSRFINNTSDTMSGWLRANQLAVGNAGIYSDVTVRITARGTTDNYLIYAEDGGRKFSVDDDGHTYSASGASFTTVQIRGGADIAEPFNIASAQSVEAGMVVAIDPENPGELRLADSAYDRTVAGIVSGAGDVNPGMLLRQEGTKADGNVPVALTGRVYAWVDADANGSIEPGDLLTTSPTLGHAMKATDRKRSHGAILGKAMSRLEKGKGLVLALVVLQ